MTADTLQHDKHPSPKPPRSRTVVKGFVWLAVGMLALLLCAGLLLTYWFPSNLVREELEVRLSELLQDTVTIQSLSFNALTGLNVGNLAFHKPDHPPLTLERLKLDYSLLGLLRGTFTINEVTVEGADISLNLPELTQAAPSEPPDTPPPAEPTRLPTFPISIDLDTLAIIDSHVQVTVSPDLQVELSNLNLLSSGAVSPEDANLKGQLTIDQVAMDFQGKHVHLPLDITFHTQIDLSRQHFNLQELTLASTPGWRMTFSGTVSNLFTPDNIDLSLTKTQFNLDAIMKTAQDFVPSEWASTSLQGSLSPTFSIKGALPEGQFLGTIQAGLQANDLRVNLPSLALDLGPTTLDIRAEDIRIQRNQPTEGTVSGKGTVQDLTFQSYALHNLDVVLASDGHMTGPLSAALNVRGLTLIPPEIMGTSLTLPFDFTLDAKGNHRTREAHLKTLDLNLGSYGSLHAKADLTPQPSPSLNMDASLELQVRPRLQALLPLLPRDHLQGMAIEASAEPENLILRATALLQQDFHPLLATATAALKLSPIKATSDTLGVRGNVEQLTFLLSSHYQKEEGAFHGTMGFSTKFSGIHAKKSLRLEAMNLILKSSFQGNLSPTFQPIHIRSHDQLQMALRNMAFSDPSLTATVPSLRLLLNTKEDLMKKDFAVERFAVLSENILDLNLQGRFSQETQQFDFNLQAPLIHIGNLLPHLSGPLMEGMDAINPRGRLELTMQGAGRLPENTDLEKFALPFGLKSTLRLHDLAGAVAGYQVEGGNGTLAFGYSPNASPQSQLTTGLQIDRIGLPNTLPIRALTDMALKLNLTSPNLNEVHLDPIHVTARGVDLSTKAVLVGLREFFSSSTTSRGTQLSKLFVQLHTQLGLDLEPFQAALQPYGVSGKGKTQVGVHLHKREQGDLSASINLDAEKLSIAQEGTELKKINGGLHIRKTLRWDAGGLKAPAQKRFLPSDRIAQLKMLSGKEQQISIEEFTLGPLSVQKFSTHIAFQQHVLRIQNLAMNVLGGGIGGNMAIAVEHPLRVSADFDIANLNINELMTAKNRIAGDSTIAATVVLDANLQDETGAVDLSRLSCQLNITHIGKDALDRLLVFLDPEGRNPTLSNARAQLQLANPSLVHIDIARGQLNLVIEFQGSLIPTFTLNRIPIAKMKNIETLTAAIPNWKTLIPLLDMLGADTYSFSPEGELIMR
ncbi:MAG: AsmA family protein [Nitrospirales bacterium]